MKNKKFKELIGREIDEHGLKVIQTLDKQLTEDKALFRFLVEDGLVDEEGRVLIAELLYSHTCDFKYLEKENGR